MKNFSNGKINEIGILKPMKDSGIKIYGNWKSYEKKSLWKFKAVKI